MELEDPGRSWCASRTTATCKLELNAAAIGQLWLRSLWHKALEIELSLTPRIHLTREVIDLAIRLGGEKARSDAELLQRHP
jgi:hypothetical protein